MIRAAIGVFLLASAPVSFVFVEVVLPGTLEFGNKEKSWIMEANGAGVAVLDYDGDGFMDLVTVNGSSVAKLAQLLTTGTAAPREHGVFLYRNLRNGKFEDVTSKAKLINPYWGTGANAIDFDTDGFTDILITNIGRDLLFRNNGDGTFTEVGQRAGLSQTIAWHTGSAFGDYDGDGDPDLYIAGYVNVQSLGLNDKARVCRYLELPVFCGPMGLKGETDVFYRNEGKGLFRDVTKSSGLQEHGNPRYGFTAVFEDFNQDGHPDVFVANDSTPNYLYLNDGKGGFEESGLASGLGFNADGKAQANMGVAVGDVDNDGDVDLLTTTFSEDYFPLFEQTQKGIYEEVSARVGVLAPTTPLLGWACGFADLNNDGWRDLWLVNGHVYPTIAKSGRSTYEQDILAFKNERGTFRMSPVRINKAKQSWRGGASADFNNDGSMDLIATPIDGPPVLFENRGTERRHWIGVALRRQSVGARVEVEGCGNKWFDTVRNGGSYLSANDPRQHFGLETCSEVARIRVLLPNGQDRVIEKPAVDRYHSFQ